MAKSKKGNNKVLAFFSASLNLLLLAETAALISVDPADRLKIKVVLSALNAKATGNFEGLDKIPALGMLAKMPEVQELRSILQDSPEGVQLAMSALNFFNKPSVQRLKEESIALYEKLKGQSASSVITPQVQAEIEKLASRYLIELKSEEGQQYLSDLRATIKNPEINSKIFGVIGKLRLPEDNQKLKELQTELALHGESLTGRLQKIVATALGDFVFHPDKYQDVSSNLKVMIDRFFELNPDLLKLDFLKNKPIALNQVFIDALNAAKELQNVRYRIVLPLPGKSAEYATVSFQLGNTEAQARIGLDMIEAARQHKGNGEICVVQVPSLRKGVGGVPAVVTISMDGKEVSGVACLVRHHKSFSLHFDTMIGPNQATVPNASMVAGVLESRITKGIDAAVTSATKNYLALVPQRTGQMLVQELKAQLPQLTMNLNLDGTEPARSNRSQPSTPRRDLEHR